MSLVPEYYDASCSALHQAVFADMRWLATAVVAGANAPARASHIYINDLKRLKKESRRDGSVLQSRSQTATLASLGMSDGLGLREPGPHDSLNAMCMRSLLVSLPAIDPRLERYVASFHAPNVALFLRLVRCTNIMAFEHMARTHATAAWQEQFESRLRFFPAGTAADLAFIMQHAVSNTRVLHSLSLQPTPGLAAAQSSNVLRSVEYTWVEELLLEIGSSPLQREHRHLNGSPLWRKLLLAHKAVHRLLHSLVLDSSAVVPPLVFRASADDVRRMQKKVVCALMPHVIMYYVHALDRHSEIDVRLYLEAARDRPLPVPQLRAIAMAPGAGAGGLAPGADVFGGPPAGVVAPVVEDDATHAARILGVPVRYTRLTWPLRDLNYYTRLGVSEETLGMHGQVVTYPHHWSLAHSGDFAPDEQTLFDFLLFLQDEDELRRRRRATLFEKGLPMLVTPLQVPPAVAALFAQEHPAREALLAQVADAASAATYRQQHSEGASPNIALLAAYRWKGMLMAATLLSALNGICHELRHDDLLEPFISDCAVVGPERRAVGFALVLQGFGYEPESSPLTRMRVAPLTFTPPPLRQGVLYLFRTRRLVNEPSAVPGASAIVDLSRCEQNGLHFERRRRRKMVWRTDALDAQTYLCEKLGASVVPLGAADYNWRITSGSGIVPGTSQWYDFVRA